MKIAFISGPYESLGLQYLSAMVRRAGHETKLFIEPCMFRDDAIYVQNSRLHRITDLGDYIARAVKKYNPDIVGMSVVSDYYKMYLDIAEKIKNIINVPIIFGGIHPSAVGEKVLESPAVNYVCVGEGEYAFAELLEAIAKGRHEESIKNIWYRKNGGIVKSPLRSLIENLDDLPYPDKDLYYSQSSFFRHTYTCMTSRGCFFDCAYCFNSYYKDMYSGNGTYFRRRSVGNVMKELVNGMRNRLYSNVRFADDIFNHDKKWFKSFFGEYKKEINKPFDCQLWLDSVDRETAEILKESGCYLVEIGVQSFSRQVREKVLGRFYENSAIEKSIDILKRSGIRVLCENIYGLPSDDRVNIKAALKFYAKKKVLVSFYGLRFYPKTRIVDIAKDKKILSDDDVKRIEEGGDNLLFTYGGDNLTEDFIRIHVWLLCSYLLPVKLLLPYFERIFESGGSLGWILPFEKTLSVFRARPFSIAFGRIATRMALYLKFIMLKTKDYLVSLISTKKESA